MKRHIITMALLCGVVAGQAAVRDTISINRGWSFHLGPLDDVAMVRTVPSETVSLPHDFLIGQPWVEPDASERPDNSDAGSNVRSRLSARGFKEMNVGWYRYVFTPDAAWKDRRVALDIQGIMLTGDVWFNGQRVGGTDYGYLGFDADISSLIRYGEENEIIVRADTQRPENSRWYTGGGLYRDVNIIVSDRQLYFPRHPLFIRTSHNREVNICAEIVCSKDMTRIPVTVRILDAEGNVVAEKRQEVAFNRRWRDREYQLDPIELPDARLWSCESPYLYTAEVTLSDADGNVTDRISEQFGVREVEFSPDCGFRLNGRKVLLKGYANHHTLGALGAAAFPRAIEKRLKMMKAFGFNHVRTSHNPYSESFLRLCDRLGILVVDELYDKWLSQYAGGRAEWESLWQKNIPEWVKRDRNHPSVILWSLGNELQQYPNLPFNDWGVTAYRLQRELLHRYDPSRLTTVAMHPRYRSLETDSLPAPLAVATDVNSYNYRYMYFPGDARRYPEKTFYQSEASVSAMGPNFFGMDLGRVVGLAYWGAIDYLGESMGWPQKGWNQGVFDISLQPKPEAYFAKSILDDSPEVHIAVIEPEGDGRKMWNGINVAVGKTSENWNRTAGERVALYTYTNGDEVELFVNGKSMGVKRNPQAPESRNRIRWDNIEYRPGTVSAVARRAGKPWAKHELHTAGEAVSLSLVPDTTAWYADGQDLMHVRVSAVDSRGRRVFSAGDRLRFSVEGGAEIIAADNGNIVSDEIATSHDRHLFMGSALVILRASTKPSKVTLKVESDRFKTRRMTLYTR